MPKKEKTTIKEIGLEKIDEPHGRIRFSISPEKVQELADNISEVGLLQAIVVREIDGRYEIIAGHRRYLAFVKLGKSKIPCTVRVMSDTQCAVARASENLGRVDLSPVEEAAIYSDLRDNHGLTIDQIAKQMGPSPGVIKRRLDLLKMPPQLQKEIHARTISYGVAEELWRLGDESVIDYYLGYAVDHGVTVAVARQWVNDHRRSKRTRTDDVGEGGQPAHPLEERPVYLTCEICQGPTQLQDAVNMTMCRKCLSSIQGALQQPT